MNLQIQLRKLDALTKANLVTQETSDIVNNFLTSLDKKEFDYLVQVLHSDQWPVAVEPELICDNSSELDKLGRATAIIENAIFVQIQDKKVLDFGCGEGHLCEKMIDYGVKDIFGYDVIEQWQKRPIINNLTFTTNFDQIKQSAPYDVIIVYDVLDHVINPQEELKKIHELCNKNTDVYIRFHPWCSKHSTHLYNQINKGYLHLVFTKEELDIMGYKPMQTVKIIHPIDTYRKLAANAKFNIAHEYITRDKIDNFYKNDPIVANRIKMNWIKSLDTNLSNGTIFPEFQIEQQFFDLILNTQS